MTGRDEKKRAAEKAFRKTKRDGLPDRNVDKDKIISWVCKECGEENTLDLREYCEYCGEPREQNDES